MSPRRRCKSSSRPFCLLFIVKPPPPLSSTNGVPLWRPPQEAHARALARARPLAQACLTADRRQVDGRHLDSNRERKMVEAMSAVRSRRDEVPAGGKMFYYHHLFVTIIIFFFYRPVLQMSQSIKERLMLFNLKGVIYFEL